MRLTAGTHSRLGASWDGRGTNFAFFSANAEKVELCLFDSQGRRELERVALPERTEDVWHGYLPDVSPGRLYGYRVYGPYAPEQGHRFNANKVLLDRMPSGRRPTGLDDALFGYHIGSAGEDLVFDRRDKRTARPWRWWSIRLSRGAGSRSGRASPGTRRSSTSPTSRASRSTPSTSLRVCAAYSGLASSAMIGTCKRLGVTTVELLLHHALRRPLPGREGLANYWGYNSLSFFAPASRYGHHYRTRCLPHHGGGLHDAGIEVMLDVVYNHTAEGNQLGPTLCYRGIDNASYYWLKPDNKRYYDDFTGCGSSVNLSHPRVLQMVIDSLRYWVEVCHVDGFRFDLATTLARGPNGFDRNAAFLTAIRQDPVLASVKLVAEPWDLGLGGYQVGGFPHNGRNGMTVTAA